jgi:hypothetical protein
LANIYTEETKKDGREFKETLGLWKILKILQTRKRKHL